MKIVHATPDEISRWHSDFLDACTDRQQWVQVVTGLGGDRLTAVQDRGGFFAKDEEEIVGVVTFSETGEYNKPNIVGLWVKDHNIVIAADLIRCAIDTLADSLHCKSASRSWWTCCTKTNTPPISSCGWARTTARNWTCIAIPFCCRRACMTKKKQRGGRREGAERKPIDPERRKRPVTVWLSPDERRLCQLPRP